METLSKVLVVEDEEPIRRNLRANLEDMGYCVVTAANGREGLEVCAIEKPDIVLTDLRMPEMDGLEFVKAMEETHPDTPIIVVSGTGTIRDAIDAHRRGAWDYLLKPLQNVDELDITIQRALERALLLSENRYHQAHLEELVVKKTKELIALEGQLHKAQKMEAIGTLVGGIAHDFNNILMPIIGYTEMALEDLDAEGPIHDALTEVMNAGRRATDLVRQILTFSRQTEHCLQPINLCHITKEALKLLRATIPSTIEIRQNIQEDCGMVMADPTQIHQVLMNLCTNGYHAMRERGGLLSVTLTKTEIGSEGAEMSGLPAGQYVQLKVSDTGHGMDETTVERVFEPYFTTKAKGEGTGLGLAVVHGVVKRLKGHISVSSEKGRGTSFSIYLPTVGITANPECPQVAGEALGGKERILIVDDEEVNVELLYSMLVRLGYNVTQETSSEDALNCFQAFSDTFDLVITDMTMPGMTGVDLTRKILSLRPGTPVIICSGFSDGIDEDNVRALGAKGYLRKPVLKTDLAVAVRKALDEGAP